MEKNKNPCANERAGGVEFGVLAEDARDAVAEKVAQYAAEDAGDYAHQHGDYRREIKLQCVGRTEDAEKAKADRVCDGKEIVGNGIDPIKGNGANDENDDHQPRRREPKNWHAPEQKVAHGTAAKGSDECRGRCTDNIHVVFARFERARNGGGSDGDVGEDEEKIVQTCLVSSSCNSYFLNGRQ